MQKHENESTTGEGTKIFQPTVEKLRNRFTGPFSLRCVGACGHEITNGQGMVICFTGDRMTALVVAGLLEGVFG